MVLTDHGSYLGKSKEQFKITYGMSDKPVSYLPATKLSGFIIDANVTISSGAFNLLRHYGIPVIWQDRKNDDGMLLQAFNAHGSVEVRRSQYSAIESELGVIISSKIVYAACHNKLNTLRRLQRYCDIETDIDYLLDDISAIIDEFTNNDDRYSRLNIDLRQYLMNTEAQVAKKYYSALANILEFFGWEFETRSRRPARDPFNALLNYGYAILKGRLTQSLAISGLDTYAGFLHTDRSGRESLVLDIIEEFRQIAVDEVIFRLIMQEEVLEHDFELTNDGVEITKEVKKIYIPALFEHFEVYFRSLSLSSWFIYQGRELSGFLRGTRPDYRPFLLKVGDPFR